MAALVSSGEIGVAASVSSGETRAAVGEERAAVGGEGRRWGEIGRRWGEIGAAALVSSAPGGGGEI